MSKKQNLKISKVRFITIYYDCFKFLMCKKRHGAFKCVLDREKFGKFQNGPLYKLVGDPCYIETLGIEKQTEFHSPSLKKSIEY